MKIFKNIKIGVLTLAFAFTFNACDGWLEPDPLSFYTPENAMRDYRGLMSATHMMMRDLRFMNLPRSLSAQPAWVTELVFSDVAVFGRTDTGVPPQDLIRQITPEAVVAEPLNGQAIGFYWRILFQGIRDANLVLSRAETAHFDNPEQKNRILAIGRFHRAYRYYRLVHQFGDVPLIMEELRGPRFDFYSTQREVILRYMKRDLEEVAEFLPQNTDRGTVNQGAMFHLLTKINLALGEFDDAIYTASRVIDGGFHALMESRFGIDAADPRRNVIWDLHRPENIRLLSNSESILILLDCENSPGMRSPVGTESMRLATPFAFMPGQILAPNNVAGFITGDNPANHFLWLFGRGVGDLRPTWYSQRMIWTLDNTDLRRCRESQNWVDMEDLYFNNPALRGTPYYGMHLSRDLFELPDGQGGTWSAVVDTIRAWWGWPNYKINTGGPTTGGSMFRGGWADRHFFRLAATYLFRAEAHYWLGDYAAAAADINRVRVRAGARPITAAEVDMRMILDERARELFMEEQRKTELTRISFLYAKTGKTSYLGTTYNMATFSQSNFWFDHIMHVTDFYNRGVRTAFGNEFTMAPHHVLWPIPANAIAANTQGRINQNWGYPGFENNVPPIDRPN